MAKTVWNVNRALSTKTKEVVDKYMALRTLEGKPVTVEQALDSIIQSYQIKK